jgi:hypothetical protein
MPTSHCKEWHFLATSQMPGDQYRAAYRARYCKMWREIGEVKENPWIYLHAKKDFRVVFPGKKNKWDSFSGGIFVLELFFLSNKPVFVGPHGQICLSFVWMLVESRAEVVLLKKQTWEIWVWRALVLVIGVKYHRWSIMWGGGYGSEHWSKTNLTGTSPGLSQR